MKNHLLFAFICWCIPLMSEIPSTAVSVNYQLMDAPTFQKIVVGNTILGVTRHTNSLYMLYFAPNGTCEMWKENQVYEGNWWTEKDDLGRDFVRAFWPQYISEDPQSLFSPENPHVGSATSVWYYVDSEQSNKLLIGTKTFQASVLLAPGKTFPLDVSEVITSYNFLLFNQLD